MPRVSRSTRQQRTPATAARPDRADGQQRPVAARLDRHTGNDGAGDGGQLPAFVPDPEGTDTSIRVGGQISEVTDYYFQNGPANNSPQNTTVSDNGQLQSIPISGVQAARGSGVFLTSPRESKIGFETRTPRPRTAKPAPTWSSIGAVRPSSLQGSVQRYLGVRQPRAPAQVCLWHAGRLARRSGQLELLRRGCQRRNPRLRRQCRRAGRRPYPAGSLHDAADLGLGRRAVVLGRNAGNRHRHPGRHHRLRRGPSSSANSGPGLPGQLGGVCTGVAVAGTACAASPVLVANPTKAGAPDRTAALYIPQPWGHMDFSFVLRPDLELSDGAYLSRTFVGYGGQSASTSKPGWFTPEG